MAKLTDLTEWMAETLRGDHPRARSLTQVARKAGVFAKGGRGTGSPKMTPADAANALILALYDGAPTECVGALEEIAFLEPWSVEVAPNGPRGNGTLRYYGKDVFEARYPVPHVFEDFPIHAWAAIQEIFEAGHRPYHLDEITLSLSDFGPAVSITVHDLEKEIEPGLESETDFFQFRIQFRPAGCSLGGFALGKRTEHHLSGDQLDYLYCLIHDLDLNLDHDGPSIAAPHENAERQICVGGEA